MTNIIPNIAYGRGVELGKRVIDGDPSDARLYFIPVERGAVTDADLADADTFAAMVTLGLTERTANGWNRKTLTSADLSVTTDDTANDNTLALVNAQSWTPTNAGDTVDDLILCYASVAAPTNSQLLPIGVYGFSVTPAGVTETVNAGDLWIGRAD